MPALATAFVHSSHCATCTCALCVLQVKALTAMGPAEGWPACCLASGWFWIFAGVFCSVGVLTVLWLRIVYTRFETTTGLPIEYGTVQLCSVLGGLLLYEEYTYLSVHQSVLIAVGLTIVLLGVAFSSRKTVPECLVDVLGMPRRSVRAMTSAAFPSHQQPKEQGRELSRERSRERQRSLWLWPSMKRLVGGGGASSKAVAPSGVDSQRASARL